MVSRVLLLLMALGAVAFPLSGDAPYRFRVTSMDAWVQVRGDGTAALSYEITFRPDSGSHPVDIVDIGLPSAFYRLDTAWASIGGQPARDIRPSQFVNPGVEVHLGSRLIPPGTTGTLKFSIVVANQVQPDSTSVNDASLLFQTTWFGSEYVSGPADSITVQVDLPPGSRPDTSRYHTFSRNDYVPTDSRFDSDRVSYLWRWENVRADRGYTVGVSFPRALVAAVYAPPEKGLGDSLMKLAEAFFGFLLVLLPLSAPILIVVLLVVSARRRRRHYLPPVVGVESGGIKRGLTPPEAALLQEMPLTKVLLLVIYGMVRKGALEVKPDGGGNFRFRKAAPFPEGVELRQYEKEFLTAVAEDGTLAVGGVRAMMTAMIKALGDKMRGFSRRETIAYTRSIMAQAWEQVRNAPSDRLPAALAENLDWLTLDDEAGGKLDEIRGDILRPTDRPEYWYHRLPFPGKPGAGGAEEHGSGVSAAASRFVAAMQGFSDALVGDPGSFTASVTRALNPPPVAPHSARSIWSGGSPTARTGGSGGSSSGGHSCACACACACAGCACACAGGGR